MDYTKLSAVGMPAAPARKSATKRVTDSKRPMRRVNDSNRQSLKTNKVSDTMAKLRRARMIRKKVQDALADTENTEDAQVAALGCVGPDCSAEEVIASVVDILGDVIDRIEGEGAEDTEEPAEEPEEAPVEDSLKRKAAFRRTLKRVKDALEETEDTEGAIDAALECIDANTPATDVLEAVITVLGSAIDDLSGEGDEEPIDEEPIDEGEEPIDEDMPEIEDCNAEIEDCGASKAKDSARRKSVPARARKADSKTPKKTQIKKATPKKNTKK